jgi:hypothetical protein
MLLGDSIFDNASYVAGGPDVVTHLKREMPQGWRATLSAIDGAITGSIPMQYGRVPRDATHLVFQAAGSASRCRTPGSAGLTGCGRVPASAASPL